MEYVELAPAVLTEPDGQKYEYWYSVDMPLYDDYWKIISLCERLFGRDLNRWCTTADTLWFANKDDLLLYRLAGG